MVSLYVGITDYEWFRFLSASPSIEEVNFWQPGGRTNFRAVRAGELFLFKLHAPQNFIVGGGVFARAEILPTSIAWDAFGQSNGAVSLSEMRERIARYREQANDPRQDYMIGCRILTQPFFLSDREWIPVPESWSPHIQQGRTYDTAEADGRQGAFRIGVTGVYQRRCAVTGERTLPILDAAHIRPYGAGGDHEITNGLLLRTDVHRLFDLGYVTVSGDGRFQVGRRLKEDFENGRHYYSMHGKPVALPNDAAMRPAHDALEWHQSNKFLG